MVFTGDWNGGERRFALRAGERVELVRMSRFDPATRDWRQLAQGGLDAVDRWDWHDRRTLRWRSRLPSDPPFDGTEIVYRLETVYRRILQPAGEGRYRLKHDFAFTEREGPIERFSVALAFDPAWEPATAGINDVNQALRNAEFERLLSDAYGLLGAENFTEAGERFRAALAVRPGSREAQDGLVQAEQGAKLAADSVQRGWTMVSDWRAGRKPVQSGDVYTGDNG